jgi:hypothetical protein
MRKVISCLIILCVLSAIPLLEVSGASLAIGRLSKKTAGPFDVIKIYGAGFTDASDMRVIFANGAYVVTVPAICGTKTTLEVGVPFFFDTKTGAIKSAVVSVTVKSISLGIKSNTLSGFTITDLPRTTQAAGTVTLAFLKDLKTLTGYTKGQLEFLQKASKGKVNTTKAKSHVSKMATNLGALQTALIAIQKGQAITQGSSIKITKASLAVSDRLILGFLAQLDAVVKAPLKTGLTVAPERDWVPPDGLAIPSLKEIYEKLASYAEEKGFDQQVLFEYLKRSGAWVGTATGLLALAGYGTTLGTVAGGVGLVYAIGVTGFVLTEYACFFLGLPSGVNEAEGFWPLLEDVLRTSLQLCGFPLEKVCNWKLLVDLFLVSLDGNDLNRQLLGPVKKATPTIIPQFHWLTVEGAWAGRMGNAEMGYFPITANFTDSGLAISGTLNDGTDNYPVSGIRTGFVVSFDLETSFETWTGVYEFFGRFSEDRGSMSGDWELTVYHGGEYVESMKGTWILSR